MAKQPHPFDVVSDELQSWLDEESKYYIQALVGDYQAPFAAQVSEKEKLDYYRRQVFVMNPDGTPNYEQPNPEGRKQLIERVGIDGYASIIKAVGPNTTLMDLDAGEV